MRAKAAEENSDDETEHAESQTVKPNTTNLVARFMLLDNQTFRISASSAKSDY